MRSSSFWIHSIDSPWEIPIFLEEDIPDFFRILRCSDDSNRLYVFEVEHICILEYFTESFLYEVCDDHQSTITQDRRESDRHMVIEYIIARNEWPMDEIYLEREHSEKSEKLIFPWLPEKKKYQTYADQDAFHLFDEMDAIIQRL